MTETEAQRELVDLQQEYADVIAAKDAEIDRLRLAADEVRFRSVVLGDLEAEQLANQKLAADVERLNGLLTEAQEWYRDAHPQHGIGDCDLHNVPHTERGDCENWGFLPHPDPPSWLTALTKEQ
jgi:hypothetical protein